MKILITGGNGYIAKSLYSDLKSKHDVTLATRLDLDLACRDEVGEYFADKYFDVVIHTAVKGGFRLVSDDTSVVMTNLLMHDNLMRCRDKFDRLIYFGSGAEDEAITPYGFSKHIINELTKHDPKIINVKIYAVFDENELDTRFIKSNIERYLLREDMIIHKNRKMDFFYMKDLISLVNWLIEYRQDEFPTHTINCNYTEKHTLLEVAQIINLLAPYKVGIEFTDKSVDKDYCGDHGVMPIRLVGLKQGIINTYNALKSRI